MRHLFKQQLQTWLRLQFHNNPIVFDRVNYLTKIGQAFKVWCIALAILFAIAVVGCTVVLGSSLNN